MHYVFLVVANRQTVCELSLIGNGHEYVIPNYVFCNTKHDKHLENGK